MRLSPPPVASVLASGLRAMERRQLSWEEMVARGVGLGVGDLRSQRRSLPSPEPLRRSFPSGAKRRATTAWRWTSRATSWVAMGSGLVRLIWALGRDLA